MATIRNIISYVDAIKPNAFDEGVKVQWVNEVEGYIQTEVMMLALADTVQYDPDVHMDTVLLVKPPHDKLYSLYLCALVDFANGEYDKYNNTMQMYNKFLGEYIKWYTRVFHPADGGCVREGYYLSAYTLAVRHGFEGTEEEWIASLKGESAYEEAQLYGYTGTREEFGRDQAGFAEAASAVRTDRAAAAAAAAAAEISAQNAAEAAGDATSAAGAASDAAERASSSEGTAASAASAAKASEEAAKASETAAASSATAAGTSETNAKASEDAAKTSETNAGTSASSAAASAESAESNASKASSSALAAAGSADQASRDSSNALVSAGNAAASATAAETARASAEQIAEGIPKTVQDALQEAKDSGEFDGEPGVTPHIGANGNWFVGETDTGVKAQGEDGDPGDTPQKGVDYWTEADKAEMVNDVLAALPTWEGGSY